MVNATLYLLHYNNYYNRQVKKESSLSAYLEYEIGEPVTNINFIPNDFINTQQIINWDYEDPDYVVVVDEDNQINSRWFIVSTARTRAGQLRLELHRDLVVDYYDAIVDAPMFVEKATPQSIRDPAIYNKEDMTFNQIKQRIDLLYDETKSPWIVGYIPRDSFPEATTVQVSSLTEGIEDYTFANLSDYPYFNDIVEPGYLSGTVRKGTSYSPYVTVANRVIGAMVQYLPSHIYVNQKGIYEGLEHRPSVTPPTYESLSLIYTGDKITTQGAKDVVVFYDRLADKFSKLRDYTTDAAHPTPFVDSDTVVDKIIADNGKIIRETTSGKFYKISVVESSSRDMSYEIDPSSELGLAMNSELNHYFGNNPVQQLIESDNTDHSPFNFEVHVRDYIVRFVEFVNNISVTIPKDRYHTSNSPYDIFAMPYSDTLTIYDNGAVHIQKTDKESAVSIAQQVMAKVGTGNVYDVQILPYCPVRYCIKSDGSFDIGNKLHSDVTLSDGTPVNTLLWAVSDEIDLTLPFTIPEKQTVEDKKVSYSTDFIRLVSPNQSNMFNFNPQMNNGLDAIKITCQYKPFIPYIKVQPVFKSDSLYGTSYDDARALICGGDYSVSQVTSAWADYQLNNKNYLAIFDRQIENIELTNSVQKDKEIFSAITGSATGAGTGAIAGSMLGPAGTVAGAALGGAASALGGVADVYYNNKLRTEALDYTKDMFGYNLGNIQAIPQGLAKTSAISPDNKYVPFVEFYSCSDREKQALRDKLKYNGYTIMMIGKLKDYLNVQDKQYVKGKLIRLDNIDEDFHVINAIADELYKGVFV